MDDELADRAPDTPFAGSRRRIDRGRHHKLQRLCMQGNDPFPDVRLTSRSLASEIHTSHDPHQLDPGEQRACWYLVAGRLLARRKHRHAVFLDLGDRSGIIELCVRRDQLDREQHSQLLGLDIGDIVSAEGWIYVTDNHTLTLLVTSSQLLSKALRSPPAGDRHRDMQTEPRHPQRELDLLASQQTRMLFEVRSTVNEAIRGWMGHHQFIELEGPVLQRSRAVSPVLTDREAAIRGLVLRTSSRQYLRRCLLGGLERVYDLGKRFPRSCSMGRECPELTMLEWSTAYVDYTEAAHQCEELIAHTAATLAADTQMRWSGPSVELGIPWRTTTVRDAILERCGLDILASTSPELADRLPGVICTDGDWDTLVCELFTRRVEPLLVQPTLVYDFPLAGRELVKRHPTHEQLASDFRAIVGGLVLAEGNGELNDPHEAWVRTQGLADSHEGTVQSTSGECELDLLEYGLCPAASVELHVDRLLMLLTASETVRDVIPFPLTARRD
jgi:lysyl-tRNA synthetase, class II